MKKIIAFVIGMAMMISFIGCQPTPEEIVVRGKNLESMIEKATTQQPDAEPSNENESIGDKTHAPEIYKNELSDAMGKVLIHLDAAVVVPNYNKIPVQRVTRGSFSQQQVDILFNRLIKGEPFSGDSYVPSKDDVHRQILEAEAEQVDISLLSEEEKMEREYLLKQLEEKLEKAPDTGIKNPVSSQLIPMSPETDYAAGEKVYALAQSQAGGYESFSAYNYSDSTANILNYTSEKNFFSKNMGIFEKEETEALTISEHEARQQAETLVDALGLGDVMECYSCDIMYGGSYDLDSKLNPRKQVWFLRYTRNVSNTPVTYTSWDCMKVEEEAQSAPWSYEDMTFAVDDTGIVGFSWKSPYEVTDTVTEDSNLISFDEVMEIFKTMSLAVNSWDGYSLDNPDLVSIEIDVSEIRLGLSRVTEKDRRNSGLLIPVWDFLGTVTYISESDGKVRTFENDTVPVLTVNAIDGSIIDRSLGY